jgi:hypothetical protein
VKPKETVIAFIGLGAPLAGMVRFARNSVSRETHMSQASRTRASHTLNGGPPSRAKDHSCLELVVTVFTAQEISRTSITVVKAIVAPRDRVALRTTSTYG